MRSKWTILLLGFFAYTNARANPTDKTQSVKNAYILHCAGCHGLNGNGLPENGIPDFHESGRFLSSAQGRKYLIQVPGVSQSSMNNQQVADVMNWILSHFSSNSYRPYTEAEVARLRTYKASDAVSWREQLTSKN